MTRLFFRKALVSIVLFCVANLSSSSSAADDPQYPFRTDFCNEKLPWYQLKPGEFPPLHSEHRIGGNLVEADFIHRTGQFRSIDTGELVNFKMPPFGLVSYLNTEADLRDVPMAISCQFFMYQDEKGAFNKLVELNCPGDTRISIEAQKLAADQQRKNHSAFLKARGLAGWIDRVEGKKFAVTFFGERASTLAFFKEHAFDPALWAKEHRTVRTAAANEELRTYNPEVDKETTTFLEIEKAPEGVYGCSGERWVIQPNLMLEGFRKGHIVRVFLQGSWKVEDMPVGENLYNDSISPETHEIWWNQFPFRLDSGNEKLPWFQLKPGEFPPLRSEHRVYGELIKIDDAQRSGQFRPDNSAEPVNFKLTPLGAVMHRKADAELGDIPLGTRCLFYLYQDEKGAFTQAAQITDEFTYLAHNSITHRIEELKLAENKLIAARQLPPAKNYHDEMIKTPAIGRSEIAFDDQTRVWKDSKPAKLSDLTIGDELLVNFTGRTAKNRGRCTDIWAGAETHAFAAEQQRKKRLAFILEHGAPALIDTVEGKKITVLFLSGLRKDLVTLVEGDPKKAIVYTALTDKDLRAQGPAAEKMNVNTRTQDTNTFGCYGSSGVRWILEAAKLPDGYQVGQIVRIFKDPWPKKDGVEKEKPAK